MRAEIFAEELLMLLAYGLDLFTRPTFRNWDQSYEGWLSRNGLLRRAQYLESQKLIAREQGKGGWVLRLTDEGRRVALGGRDPEAHWRREWDGVWRLFLFDLPVEQKRARAALLRWLRRNGFGYLQDSVWIRPEAVAEFAKALRPFLQDVECFTLLECRCVAGFKDDALVRGAWRFDEINKAYRAYQAFAAESARRLKRERLHPRQLFPLLGDERTHWTAAFVLDPLLPRRLWPTDYEGERAWQARKQLLGLAASQVPTT